MLRKSGAPAAICLKGDKTCPKPTRPTRRWHTIATRKLVMIALRRLLGIASLVAQMQVRISDVAELLVDRGGQCARAAAHGKSVGWQRDLPMVHRQHGRACGGC